MRTYSNIACAQESTDKLDHFHSFHQPLFVVVLKHLKEFTSCNVECFCYSSHGMEGWVLTASKYMTDIATAQTGLAAYL